MTYFAKQCFSLNTLKIYSHQLDRYASSKSRYRGKFGKYLVLEAKPATDQVYTVLIQFSFTFSIVASHQFLIV